MSPELPRVPAPFVYNARHERTIDGDSVEVLVDRGMRDYSRWNVRIAGINARELGLVGGAEARAALDGLIGGLMLVLTTAKPDKYGGRYQAVMAAITTGGVIDVGTELVRQGWALPWNGRGLAPVPQWPRVTAPRSVPDTAGITFSLRGLLTESERANWPSQR